MPLFESAVLKRDLMAGDLQLHGVHGHQRGTRDQEGYRRLLGTAPVPSPILLAACLFRVRGRDQGSRHESRHTAVGELNMHMF